MPPRRPTLKVIVSNSSTIEPSSKRPGRSRTASSTSSPATAFEQNIALLRRLRPGYVEVIEKLVEDAVADLEGRLPMTLLWLTAGALL